jgi:tryptophan-rich sensory protein
MSGELVFDLSLVVFATIAVSASLAWRSNYEMQLKSALFFGSLWGITTGGYFWLTEGWKLGAGLFSLALTVDCFLFVLITLRKRSRRSSEEIPRPPEADLE